MRELRLLPLHRRRKGLTSGAGGLEKGTTARPHDADGNEPDFDKLISPATVAAATHGRPGHMVLGAR
jgi:hypothetical protein